MSDTTCVYPSESPPEPLTVPPVFPRSLLSFLRLQTPSSEPSSNVPFLSVSPPHFSPSTPTTPSPFVLQEFATSGSNNTDTGKSGGHLETKYKVKELGLSFNQKWNTDNTLTTEITMEDQVGRSRTICPFSSTNVSFQPHKVT